MNHSLVAVGIGNTTINFGVCELPVGVHESPSTASGHDASPPAKMFPNQAISLSDVHWKWTQRITVETEGFDPAAVKLEIPAQATWRVASVHRASEHRLASWVRATHPNTCYCNLTAADLPIKVRVEQPGRVGMDRLVAAIAVNQLRNLDMPAVIVDAGTAITVDLVNSLGEFCGGAILPGMRLVAQALAAKTDLLPEVDSRFQQSAPAALGTSTESAIRSGLFWGSVGAIRELVERIGASESGTPQVFLTGGDAGRLAPYISQDAVFVRDLVIGGIASLEAKKT